jgi:MerR family copper efflux transcriptional regulator
MRIGQIAAAAGVNIDTLRYYERRGLLAEPKRRPSGYREYPPETVQLLRFIKRAQDLGFTLQEIEELLRLRHARGASRLEVRTLAAAKVRAIDEKITHLKSIRDALNVLVEECACGRGRPTPECPILEALNDSDPLLQVRLPKEKETKHGKH